MLHPRVQYEAHSIRGERLQVDAKCLRTAPTLVPEMWEPKPRGRRPKQQGAKRGTESLNEIGRRIYKCRQSEDKVQTKSGQEQTRTAKRKHNRNHPQRILTRADEREMSK